MWVVGLYPSAVVHAIWRVCLGAAGLWCFRMRVWSLEWFVLGDYM